MSSASSRDGSSSSSSSSSLRDNTGGERTFPEKTIEQRAEQCTSLVDKDMKKMNNEEKKKRTGKTTSKQYELYLEELRTNKAFKENQLDETRPNIIEESWKNLTKKLNASGGPVKTVQEWKRIFKYWISQVKSKTHEIKGAQQETSYKENKLKSLNDLEKSLLSLMNNVSHDNVSHDMVLTDNNTKETQQFHVLCEIRDYLKKLKNCELKQLKLEQLKAQVKYSNHKFDLSSDVSSD